MRWSGYGDGMSVAKTRISFFFVVAQAIHYCAGPSCCQKRQFVVGKCLLVYTSFEIQCCSHLASMRKRDVVRPLGLQSE